MFHVFFQKLSEQHRGLLSVVLGTILVLGALGKLGFLQTFLNIVLLAVGAFLLFWGLDKSNVLSKIKGLKR